MERRVTPADLVEAGLATCVACALGAAMELDSLTHRPYYPQPQQGARNMPLNLIGLLILAVNLLALWASPSPGFLILGIGLGLVNAFTALWLFGRYDEQQIAANARITGVPMPTTRTSAEPTATAVATGSPQRQRA